MASWGEIEAQAPELAASARRYFDAFTHKTLATLRRDGSPRISGTEVDFSDGEAWLGSMWQARKAQDLQRDPRFALHSGSPDPDQGWNGDAKLAGRAVEITDPDAVRAHNAGQAPPGPSHRFRLDITELVVVRLGEPADHLIIEAWHEGRGVSRQEKW
jgi:hypothetical protein